MTNYISEEEYAYIADEGMWPNPEKIWYYVTEAFKDSRDKKNPPTFDEQKEAFFWFLERALREGKMKLAKQSVLFEGTPEEQVQRFREGFPKAEADAGFEDFFWWFTLDECPVDTAYWFDEEYGWVCC